MPAEPKQPSTNWIQQGIGQTVQRLDDGIPGIGVDPTDQGPNDNHPDIRLEEHVQDHGHRGKEISCHKHYCLPNSSARFVAASTAAINAARTPPASRACSPAMVVPPGEATLSFSWPGCSLVITLTNLRFPPRAAAIREREMPVATEMTNVFSGR